MAKGKIVLLMGAGASTPFLACEKGCLTTAFLTKSLFAAENWDDVLAGVRGLCSDEDECHLDVAPQSIQRVLEAIYRHLQNSRLPPNFEDAIHLLDVVARKYGAMESDWSAEGLALDLWLELNDCLSPGRRQPYEEGWPYMPYLAREVVAGAILSMWHAAREAVPSTLELVRQSLCRLAKSFPSVNLYSLNYDPILLEGLPDEGHFRTGFRANGEFDPKVFLDATNSVAFLHGHVGFVPRENTNLLCRDYDEARSARMSGLFSIVAREETWFMDVPARGPQWNTWLVTGRSKSIAFLGDPFSCYLHKLGADTFDAEYVVLVGTSLQDEHLLSLIINAIRRGAKVMYVTRMSPKEVLARMAQPSIDNVLTCLWTLFGDKVTVPSTSGPDDVFGTHLESVFESLKAIGHARFTNNIVLYSRGFESFLGEPDLRQVFACLGNA